MSNLATLLNPIDNAEAYHFITVGGVKSPGVIKIDGISGFDRDTEWDVKKGKGRGGATLTLTQQPPAEGSITFVLWLASHWQQWNQFLPLLKYDTLKGTQADAFDIFHPHLADRNIVSCVVKKVGAIRHVGRGVYERTIELIEWVNPPAGSVVSTPLTSKPDANPDPPGDPPDPELERLQNTISLLSNAAFGNPNGTGTP